MNIISEKIAKTITIGLITIIISFGLFGLVFFDHDASMKAPADCFASKIDGSTCPLSIVGFAVHHVSAIKTLSIAQIVGLFSLLSLFLALSSAVSFSILLLIPDPSSVRMKEVPARFDNRFVLRWLSILENSPSN